MFDMINKKLILAASALLCCAALFAQTFTGGVKGTIVSRQDRSPVAGAALTLYQGTEQIAATTADKDGNFLISNLDNGVYDLVIVSDDFLETRVNVTVNDGYVKNMFTLSLSPAQQVSEAEEDNFVEFDMEDSGYNDNPTILFGQNDIFNNVAGFNFSAVRFRVRGYSSESQDVYLAGVKMNDAMTGYSPFSLWSGLNEATRTKYAVTGSEISDYGLGGYNGLTNIPVNASSVRKGWRASILTNSALYRLRLMLTYASGHLDNGWSYAFNVSARLGGNDWIKGVYYRSFAYYGAVEKQLTDAHRLGLVFMAAPGQRGAQNASTQEVYDLMGDNMYNSNWGYQNGKVRNARVRITHEPIAILKYDFTPSDRFKAAATLLYRFGKNGYTALDWYDAQDPRPDYYRNLPSYYFMEDTDYNRTNYPKYAWAYDSWSLTHDPSIVHVNWDRLYHVNQRNTTAIGNRSKYALEERRTDQQDLNLALNAKWRVLPNYTITGGIDAKVNRTEYYKIMNDLLGGDYFLNVDQFAERDFAAYPYMVQNDLDAWMSGGDQVVRKGDKYGYDYFAHIRRFSAWVTTKWTAGSLETTIGGRLGYSGFWREGLVRKGLFPGLADDGSPFMWNGIPITTYETDGSPITSKGDSKHVGFMTYGTKVNLNYIMTGGHRVYIDAAYLNDAPAFNMAFVSPRTRNSLVPNLTTVKTLSADVNYQYSNAGYNFRVTGFYTEIADQSDVMSFYDDLQNTFTNFAMSGIDEVHMGMELGFKVPTPISNLSLQGVLSYGEYIYTSNPTMYQTYDNSSEIVTATYGVKVPYWKSHPATDGSTVKHYVPSTPQFASSLGLAWNKNYWFIDADAEYFAKSFLDMNPLYRTDMATAGPDGVITESEIEYMAAQEEFDPVFLVNFSVGKSWYIKRAYQVGFSLNAKNVLNNRNVKTGGYEQNRLVDNTVSKERFYRFNPKYFYMCGANYMLNLYFRF